MATNNIAEKLAESINESIARLEEKTTDVNVNIDIEAIKADLVDTIQEGFKDAKYSFELAIDRERIATVIARSATTSGETFQMRGRI